VETARSHGIAHRDLTPVKIVVGADGHAALGDLGAGRRRAGEPIPLASLDYVSPEHVRGDALTAASQEYALACILFHALAGEAPFARARASAKTFWHVRAPRPLLGEHRDDLPRGLADVLARGMAIDPADRHGDPRALVEAAAAALGAAEPDPWAETRGAGPRPAAPAEPRRARGRARPAPAPPPPAPERRPAPGPEPAGDEGSPPFSSWDAGEHLPATRSPEGAAEGRFAWIDDASGPSKLALAAGAVVALALAAAAVAGGLQLGKDTKAAPAASTAGAVGTSQVALVRPGGWRELDPAPVVPGLDDGEWLAIGPPGADGARSAILAGVAEPGRDGLLPDGLLDALSGSPGRGEPVELGSLEGLRFKELRPKGVDGPLTLYAVPTSEGTATVACLGVAAAGVAARCDTQAATLQLTGPRPAGVQPARGYAKALARVFKALNGERSAALGALSAAGTRTEQSAAADRIAKAYAAAARDLRQAPDTRYVSEENAAIVTALQDGAAGYNSMSFNAARGDEAGYADARRRAIAAEGRVGAALRRLRDAGYRVR
jgi:hypothetical protein